MAQFNQFNLGSTTMKLILLAIAAFFVLSLSTLFSTSMKPDKVLMKDVTTLVLDDSRMTTGRRKPAVPQLKCRGGACEFAPERVMCEQKGWDGRDATWECKANMPGARFGKLDVTCEGWDSKNDPFIVAGSCGLEYTLVPTHSSRRDVPPRMSPQHTALNQKFDTYYRSYSGSSMSWLFFTAMIASVAYLLWKCAKYAAFGSGRSFQNLGGLSWNNLSNSWNGMGSNWRGSNAPPSYSSTMGSSSKQSGSASSGPGFWSGMFGGMGLSYLMNRNSNRSRDHLGRDVRQAEPVYVGQSRLVHSPARSPVATGPETGFATTSRR